MKYIGTIIKIGITQYKIERIELKQQELDQKLTYQKGKLKQLKTI